ncbi:stalk domain-containing protein [Paenibacillus glacialis]|uniref:Copper amine oxidase n=1 Tax=Paenibacillus glacialis TaxID=494026 RepID=A0A162LXZ9_9BACL|nr:stalk domain-containing protein [Paenibacillus glacialis]OAB35943.1 hypothetical protein PGLA_21185 [Paenibacillus glacialis]
MNKSPFNMLKLGVVSCATIIGVSASVLPMTGMAFADAVDTKTKVVISAPITAVPMNTRIQVKEVILTSNTKNLVTNIKVPQIVGMLDKKYQEQMNDIILSHAQKDLAIWEKDANEAAVEAKKAGYEYRPYELTIVYSLKENGTGNPSNLMSLVVTSQGATGGTGMPRVDTYNVFNKEEAQRVTLSDVLGDDFKEKVNAGVFAKIKANPENYFEEEFKGISEEQGFYIEKGEVVVLFPKYSIAPGSSGNPEFHFSIADNLNPNPKPVVPTQEVSSQLDLHTTATFKNAKGTAMVSLRDVAKGLGYEIKWNQATRSAELKKGAHWTNVTVGKDSYFFAKMTPVALGTAPMIKNGTLYVPITFVSDMMHVEVKNGDA